MKQERVIVKRSRIHGKGVFASQDIRKGEVVIAWDISHQLVPEDVDRLQATDKKYVAFVDGIYFLMQPPARYVNHSCAPNTFTRNFSDIAMRDIKQGEEITSDYAEIETPGFEMECHCRSPNCRGIIRSPAFQ